MLTVSSKMSLVSWGSRKIYAKTAANASRKSVGNSVCCRRRRIDIRLLDCRRGPGIGIEIEIGMEAGIGRKRGILKEISCIGVGDRRRLLSGDADLERFNRGKDPV
jgi:hypothetical protein